MKEESKCPIPGIKSPGVALGLANARPPGLTMCANAPQLPGGGGGGMGAAGID